MEKGKLHTQEKGGLCRRARAVYQNPLSALSHIPQVLYETHFPRNENAPY